MVSRRLSSMIALRHRIFLAILSSLIPALIITTISFRSAKLTKEADSRRIMNITTEAVSRHIDEFLAQKERSILNWTRDDVFFGVSLELGMTQDASSRLESMLNENDGFCLFVLSDTTGRVVAAKASSSMPHSLEDIAQNRVVIKEVQDWIHRDTNDPKRHHRAHLVRFDFLQYNYEQAPYTYVLTFTTSNTQGNYNGYLLAYIDPAIISVEINELLASCQGNGFSSARVALVDLDSAIVFGHSIQKLAGVRLDTTTDFYSWLLGLSSITTRRFDLELENSQRLGFDRVGGKYYVTSSPIRKVGSLFETDSSADSSENRSLRLITIIPEADVLTGARKLLRTSAVIGFMGILMVLVFATAMSNEIKNKFGKFLSLFDKMSHGDANELLGNLGNDEFAVAARSFNNLVEYLRDVVSVCEKVAIGDYDQTFKIRGNNDALGRAINQMTAMLAQATKGQQALVDVQEAQNKLKTAQMELNDKMQGEQDVTSLSNKIITYVASYMDAQVGALFFCDENKTAKLVATYAYPEKEPLAITEVNLGESLIGQAALGKKEILLTEIPQDCISIRSGFVTAQPRNILLMPCVYEQGAKAVIELGFLHDIPEDKLKFLHAVKENIAISLGAAESRQRLAELLIQTQILAETLKEKQSLSATNAELEKQTILLRESEARLFAQQEELRKKAQLLETYNKYKCRSEFLANMSHELRTPLNSLLILAGLLIENKDGNLSEREIGFARTIQSSGIDLLALINDVLDLSKVEAGRMETIVEETTLSDVAEYVMNNFRHVADKKGLLIDVSLSSDLPASIFTDRKRLDQILKNLLSNAIKFTERGKVGIIFTRPAQGVDLSLSGIDPHSTIAFLVTDTGKGIAQDKRDIVFEAFQQEDSTTSRKFGGTGLGLSISKQLAELLGGELQLAATSNKGSTFALYLPEAGPKRINAETPQKQIENNRLPAGQPLAVSRDTPIAPKSVKIDQPNKQLNMPDMSNGHQYDNVLGGKKVLLVDGDMRNVFSLTNALEARGLDVVVGLNGKESLAQLRSNPDVDMVLIDVVMVDMDGCEVIGEIRKDPRFSKLPIIALTANAMKDDQARCIEAGANGSLPKPVDAKNLLSLMSSWLY